jgi:hypothetical protein
MTINPFVGKEPDFYERKIKAMWVHGRGRTFHTHGDIQGHEGIWNAKGQVKGIYDAPVKTTWKTGAFQDGSRQKAKKILHRDMDLGFHCIDTADMSCEENESEFRKIFDYELDQWEDDPEPTTLGIETELSGLRMLDVLLYDTPIMEADIDPIQQQHINLILKLRAGQPMWYEEDVTTKFSSGGASGAGFIEVENPTDQVMRHKWILTRAQWNLPDPSWKGGRYKRKPGGVYKERVIPMPAITDAQGGAVVSLDKQDLMVRDVHYTNMLPLLGGKFFMHVIPPYTPKTLLPVSFTNAPAGGAMAQLVQPRRWSRPWGLE